MANAINKTVGATGRDYSTFALFRAAMPTNLTTAASGVGESWTCTLYNDAMFTEVMDLSNFTTSAACFIKVTVAAGQSFYDNASVRTNPLLVSQTRGVCFTAGVAARSLTTANTNYVTVERVQFTRSTLRYDQEQFYHPSSDNSVIRECILGCTGENSGNYFVYGGRKYINCVIYNHCTTGTGPWFGIALPGQAINCTYSCTFGSHPIDGFGAAVATNCAFFGWTSVASLAGGDYNCTNLSSLSVGTHNQVSKTASNQFQGVGTDYRLKAGADCIDHGNTDATNAPLDISGFTRGVGTAGDIGAWEYASAGPTLVKYYAGSDISAGGWTTSTGSGTLASMIDETTASDTDYIQSPVNPVDAEFEIQFAGVSTPSANTNHTISYRIKVDGTQDVEVRLIAGNGSTVVKTWTHSPGPTSYTTYNQTLTTGEADAWAAAGYAGSRLRGKAV